MNESLEAVEKIIKQFKPLRDKITSLEIDYYLLKYSAAGVKK